MNDGRMFAILMVVLIACAPSGTAGTTGFPRASGSNSGDVYRTILTEQFRGDVPLTIVRDALPYDSTGSARDARLAWVSRQDPDLPSALIDALAQTGGMVGGVEAALGRHPGATFVAVDSAPPSRMFGNTVVRLSQVVFSADSTTALAYFNFTCGSLCGAGTLLRLQRSRSGAWVIRGRATIVQY